MTDSVRAAVARGQAGFVRRNQLGLFLVGSILLGSLATWMLARVPTNPVVLPLIALPISYIPAALAVLMVRLGDDADERRAFRQRLRTWRLPVRWYMVALLGLPLVHVTGVLLATFWGGLFPVHLQMLVLLPLFLITNLGEEIGWRGYALPRLQRRFNSLSASLILGFTWAAFHWVALAQNPSQPWGYVAVGSLNLIAMSVVMTWVFNHTRGSVLLMAVLHAAYDVISIGVVPLVGTSVPLLAFSLGAGVLCLVAVVLALTQGPDLRRGGTSREPAGGLAGTAASQ